jgi:transcription elongation factor Elf1
MMAKPEERKTAAQMLRDSRGGQFECPHCGCRDFRIVQTWWTKDGEKHRAYKCRHCGKHEFNAAVAEIIRVI